MAKPRKPNRTRSAADFAGRARAEDGLASARVQFQAGDLLGAAVLLGRLLQHQPENLQALLLLARIRLQGRNQAEAAHLAGRAVQIAADSAEAHLLHATILKAAGQCTEAIQGYERTIALEPENIAAYLALASTWQGLGRFSEAEAAYRDVLTRRPDLAEVHNNLGGILAVQRRYEEAEASFRCAISLGSNSTETYYNNLGILLYERKQVPEAIACYREALALRPNFVQALTNLGNGLQDLGQSGEALSYFERAAALAPAYAPAFRQAMLLLPVMYMAPEQIPQWRSHFEWGLSQFIERIALDTPQDRQCSLSAVGYLTNFYLAYQEQNDLELQRQYGECVHRVMTACYPQWSQPLTPTPPGPGEKIRIGYPSAYLLTHSGTRWLLGWLKNHDREKFEIYCYHLGQDRDATTGLFEQASDVFHHIPSGIEVACEQVLADRLHILVYPDIGMEPKTMQMAGLRLAPMQCCAWGHPVTTGLPTVDYYFSGEAMEPENAQDHYTEKLVLLPRIGVCYSRPLTPEVRKDRADFGLSDTDFVYLSCQSLFKYLPQYDAVFAAIAERVPGAKLVFVALPSTQLTALFARRMQAAFAARGLDSTKQLRILPRQDYASYLNLLLVSNVYLDTFGFSGGNTGLEALGFHLPVVTCPGAFMRGRLAYGLLKMLDLHETVARDEAEYIEIAVRLAQDPAWRAALVHKIAVRQETLFEDRSCVDAVESFFGQVVGR